MRDECGSRRRGDVNAPSTRLRFVASSWTKFCTPSPQDDDKELAIALEGGDCSLSELLKETQLKPIERKHVLERLCNALAFLHAKQYVALDFKPQNVVVFGSLLTLKLIDLECLRKVGETIPFKLTPFYAAPELAAAALETMRLGQLPAVEYHPEQSADVDALHGELGLADVHCDRCCCIDCSMAPVLSRSLASSAAFKQYMPKRAGGARRGGSAGQARPTVPLLL